MRQTSSKTIVWPRAGSNGAHGKPGWLGLPVRAKLAQAVAMQEAGRLTKIPGIGKKTAERLLLELKDKLPKSGALGSVASPGAAAEPDAASDILNALLALGYNEKEADWAAKQLPKDAGVSDGIRQALKLLSKA